MATALILFGIVFAIGALVAIIGITISDMKTIKLNKKFKSHPYTKQFRERPLISILMDDDPTYESIKSIRNNDYRKIEIILEGEPVHGDLLLAMAPDTILERRTLSRATRQFSESPKTQAVEIQIVPEPPNNIGQLLGFYRRIANAPFIAIRSTFRVVPNWDTGWPLMLNLHTSISLWRTRMYKFFRFILYVANAAALIFVIYSAVALRHPEFLLIYLGIFALWLVTAIFMYPYFYARQKIIFLLLSPVALIYFAVLALVAPITSLIHQSRNQFLRQFLSGHDRTVVHL